MSELYGHAIGILIVIMMLTFIGIWVWAWLPRHKAVFGDLAKIPMEDGDKNASIAGGKHK